MSLKDGYKPKAQEFKLSKSKSNILDRMPVKSRDKPEPVAVSFMYIILLLIPNKTLLDN